MQAWILKGYDGVESMTLGDFPEPIPGPGEVVLEVLFAALNPADRYLAIGQYPAKPAFPHILGRDGVGRVVAVGAGVRGIAPGDLRLILRSEVGVNRPGTLAKRVAVDAAYTVEPPTGWTLEEAAAAPLVYITAWQALSQWGDLRAAAGEPPVVLVTGASGGVGVASIQLARGLGCRVLALSRGTEKAPRLRELGAELVVDPGAKDWRETVKSHLGKQRVDLAIDNIGGPQFNALLDVMGMNGRVSVVGRLAGPVPSFNTAALFFRRLRLGGVAASSYTREETVAAWRAALDVLQPLGAKPLVDRIFAFGETLSAFARLEAGPLGKVVIRVNRE